MDDAKFRWSIYEHPSEGFRALRAQYLDVTALFLGPIWAYISGLWLLGLGLSILELAVLAALVFWSKWFLLPLLVIHAYSGLGSGRLHGKALKESGWVYRGDVEAPTDITAIARVKSGQLKAKMEPLSLDFIPSVIKPVFAVAGLTWQAALRYRLFWVVAVMLVLAVVALPLVLQGDGSAKGLVNVLLTYTLAMVFVLLGATTVWLACGTLSRDVAECQMQLVVTKPIPRWQIWLGKWLGIMSLNIALLFLAGASIYGMVYHRVDSFADKRIAELRLKPDDEIEKITQISQDLNKGIPHWMMRPWVLERVRKWTLKLERDHLGKGSEERAAEIAGLEVPGQYLALKEAYDATKRESGTRNGPDWFVDELRVMLADKEMEEVKSQFLAGRASINPDLTALKKSLENYAADIFLQDVKRRMPTKYFGTNQSLQFQQVADFSSQVTQALRHYRTQLNEGHEELDPTKAMFPPDGDIWWEEIYSLAKVHMEAVGGGAHGVWVFHLPGVSKLPEDEPITLRFKLEGFVNEADESVRKTAQIAIKDNLYRARIQFGPTVIEDNLTIRTYHEYPVYPSHFGIPKELVPESLRTADPKDILVMRFQNLGRYALSIPYWKGDLELLYRESSFGVNFVRSMAVIFCWLGILGAMGLAMASFMDFHMAAFACLSLLVISLCTGVMEEVVEDGGLRQTYTKGVRNEHIMDYFSVVTFKVLNTLISPLRDYSPITSLSGGRSITWGMLGKAYLMVWGLGGGIFMVFGMGVFSRRELALYGKE